MVIFLRANDLTSDPRALKYLDYYRENDISYLVICWNRSKKNIEYPSNYIVYNKQVEYNLGKKAILSRISWGLFIFRKIFHLRKQCNVIHACDFDTVLPALPFIFLGKRVIFDIFDMFSYTIRTNKIVDFLIGLLENVSVRLSSYVIICEEERINQIWPAFRNPCTFVLPNIPIEPDPETFDFTPDGIDAAKHEGKLILSYVGAFYHGRFLTEIMETIAGLDGVILIMGGYGDREIEEACRQNAVKNSNILYLGRISYKKALAVMRYSDLLIGMYCATNRNHYYAAPNKFYESLMLKKPLITSANTAVGDKVIKYDTGFAIHDSKEDLTSLLLLLQKQQVLIDEKSINCGRVWEKYFKDYVAHFFSAHYAGMIKAGKRG